MYKIDNVYCIIYIVTEALLYYNLLENFKSLMNATNLLIIIQFFYEQVEDIDSGCLHTMLDSSAYRSITGTKSIQKLNILLFATFYL